MKKRTRTLHFKMKSAQSKTNTRLNENASETTWKGSPVSFALKINLQCKNMTQTSVQLQTVQTDVWFEALYLDTFLVRPAESVAAGQGGGGDLWKSSLSQWSAHVECVRVRAHNSDTVSHHQSTQQSHHNHPTLLWYTCCFCFQTARGLATLAYVLCKCLRIMFISYEKTRKKFNWKHTYPIMLLD